MNIGIYKWVSPSGRIYIGQSKNIKKRKEWYFGGGIKKSSMPKLKKSFEKYGIENHIFEIVEYCSLDELNEREIYWGEFYNTLQDGLNCKLGEQNCVFSDETKNKMSIAKKHISQSIDHKQKRLDKLKPIWENKKMSTENKKQNKIKYIPTQEHKNNISKSKKGKPIHSEENKMKFKEIGKTRNLTKMREKSLESRSIPVFQYDKNFNFIKEWTSSNEAERILNGKPGDNIRACIRGEQKTAYGFIWIEKP
jgi:group I intron endonuclease